MKIEHQVEAIVNQAVDKFLGWELPDFYPDGGITFKRIPNHKACGTNLFSAQEAKAMFEYALNDTLTHLTHQHEARMREMVEEVRAIPCTWEQDEHEQIMHYFEAITKRYLSNPDTK